MTTFDPAALTDRASALAPSADLAQAGAVFNDSTRLLDGGLWSAPANNHGQPAYLGMYTTDLHATLNDVMAMLATPSSTTVGGTAYTPTAQDITVLTQVQGQLQTLIADAPHSIGNSAAAVAAQTEIHNVQTSIISEIQGDGTLAAALNNAAYTSRTGASNTGFQASPTGADTAADLATASAPGDTLAHIGSVFNAAANAAIGGVNSGNAAQVQGDLQAVATGVQNILNSPTQLAQIESGESGAAAQLTTVHLQTIENELQLQTSTVDQLYQTDPNKAARETNDNLLDIIDIVQNDGNLAAAAGNATGTPATNSGFGEQPSYLTGTITHYQDTQADTHFWANFIAQANVLGSAAVNAATAVHDGTLAANSAQVQAIITDIQTYEQQGANYSTHVGGVFDARFANELVNGTLQADSAAAIAAIQSGNVDQANAAAAGFVADAADVSGNNNPVGGGAFVSQTLTVNGVDAPNPNATVAAATSVSGLATASHATTHAIADAAALSTATGAATTTAGAGATTGTGATGGAGGATGAAGGTTTTGTGGASTTTANADPAHHAGAPDFGHVDMAMNHHFGHMWG